MSATSSHRTVQLLQEFSIPLIFGVLAAMVWANVDEHSYHAFLHWSPLGPESHFNFHFVMNDLFMALFFGIAAKEITEAALPGGALNPPRKAVNPLLGTIGGVVGPVGVFFLWTHLAGAPEIANGWGIPTATDIALAWLVARLAFGDGHPAISYLLLLAVADDAIGLAIIAIFYPDPAHPVEPMYLALVVVAMALAFGLRKRKVYSYWPYLLVPGVMSWFGLYLAHLHPALALVPIVPFMPTSDHDEGMFVDDDTHEKTDTLGNFEHQLKLPVDMGLLGFGLANAGVVMSSMGAATWAVLGSLVLGKTIGIFGLSYLGDKLGYALPSGMNGRSLFVASLTAAIGLTVALFVSGVAYTEPGLVGAAKMGALLSGAVAPVVLIIAVVLKVHRKHDRAETTAGAE